MNDVKFKTRKKIALLVESSREYGRGLLLGIAQFSQVNGTWMTPQPERSLSEGIPDWFYESEFDGVILRTDSKVALREIVKTKIPVVDLRAAHKSAALVVETDDRLVTKMAIGHLLDHGHRNFGFCGYADTLANFSKRRLRFFKEHLAELGHSVSVFETGRKKGSKSTSIVESDGVNPEPDMVAWLKQLPKPIGIMACNDVRGNQILQACLENGIVVPEEIAVIGVDNDEVNCNLANPPLSSIANNTFMIGFRAAETLNQVIELGAEFPRLQLVPPLGVVPRLSTDQNLVADPVVAGALKFIRDNACSGIGVAEVVESLPVARATVERRFRKEINRSIGDEIRRIKLERVKQLLVSTDLKISAIALMTGFNHAEYMSTLFRSETGYSPGQYRLEKQRSATDS